MTNEIKRRCTIRFADVPLRVNGRISGTINGVEFLARDLQCYVQTKDGRTYTALSRVPEEIGASFQLLGNLGGVIGWLFAKPIGETKNGYELTGSDRSQRGGTSPPSPLLPLPFV